MKTFLLCLVCFLSVNVLANDAVEVKNPRTNYRKDPLGIDTKIPLLSWEVLSDQRGTLQSAYQIRAAFSEKALESEQTLLWNTGKVMSGKSNQIRFFDTNLQSGQKIYWQVRVWNHKGKVSPWSKSASFETGFLNASDWKAAWIEPDLKEDIKESNPCPMLRKTYMLKGKVSSARAYVSAHGLYQLNVNGKRVGEDLFTPGWTSYNKRLQYQIYDVTSSLHTGLNAVGMMLGDGWYRGTLKWNQERNNFGEKLAAIFQLEVTYEDGSKETFVSDNTWKASTGSVLKSDIYNGEIYDARIEKVGWDTPEYDDGQWSGVSVRDFDKQVLVASESVPVRIVRIIKPIKKFNTPNGEQVFDMGQNMTGWIQFELQGKAGSSIKLNFAEVLDKDGNFYTANLRSAKAEDIYYFKGEGLESFEPHFTFHGFRYVKVENYQGEIALDDLTGKVICSDMTETGKFFCSDSLINRLQENIQWGLRGNFLDVPTDCPQRDERLGWTGDAQVFAPTACFNVDAATFFSKWMKDMAADQKEDGNVPHVVPSVNAGWGSAGWSDAAVIIPWVIYQVYGDERILENQYKSMKAWVEYVRKKAGDSYLYTSGKHYGDWLAFATTKSDYPGATTDKDLIATAYYAYSASLLGKTAAVLGKTEDALEYGQLFEKIRNAFQKEFVTSNGRLSSNTQTAYVLSLAFGLIPEDLISQSAKRLAADVNSFKHITTGFLGTPLICDILTQYGYTDLAYRLLFRKDYPSWLYPLTKGATTIWERWDGIKPDGSFQDVGMNSFNHYSYGAVGNWLYGQVAGIQREGEIPGYKKIVIAPHPTSKFTFANGEYQSVYGKIVSGWEKKSDGFIMNVSIPANTTAKIILPVSQAENILEGGKPLAKIKDIQILDISQGHVILEVGSGNYHFSMPSVSSISY